MHQPRAVAPFLAIVLLLAAPDASAQDKGKTGITMGFPASVGFVAHVTDRFAIRPELNLSFTTMESDSILSSLNRDTSTVGVGLSALFYLGTKDKLRPYVSSRYVFGRSNSSSEASALFPETTLTAHTLAGAFGAEYSLHDRFSVFGEVGVGHTFDSLKTGIDDRRIGTRVTSTRTAVGVIFYF